MATATKNKIEAPLGRDVDGNPVTGTDAGPDISEEEAKARRAARDSAPNTDWKPELREIPVGAVHAAGNVRSSVDGLDALTASVRANGIISPIRVADIGAGQYELIYGQRRLAAAIEAGLATIPAIVDAEQPDRRDRTVDQLVENLQRADLNALDAATAYRWLLDKGLTQRQLGERLGIAQPTIANTLALLKAPEELQAQVAAGELTRSHVEAIVKLPKAEQAEVARRVVEHGLSTRDVEAEVERAASRQSEEQRRAEERKNRAANRFAAFTELLTKKKLDLEKVTLAYQFAGTIADTLELFERLGWTVKRADHTAPARGICDCTAWRFDLRYNYMSGKEVEKVSLARCCVSKKHQAAAQKAEREAFDAQQAEQRAAATKAAEEHAVALAPLTAAVTTPIPPTKAKLILFVVVGGGHDNGYWDANRWVSEVAEKGINYSGWRDELWALIDGLSHERLLVEIAQVVAQTAVDAGGRVRATIDALLPVEVPSQAEAAERLAAKRAVRKAKGGGS